jgi:hypothetical protein
MYSVNICSLCKSLTTLLDQNYRPCAYRNLVSYIHHYDHLRLGLSSGLFPSRYPTKTYSLLSSPMRATCPAHLIRLDLPNDIWG